MVVVVPLPGWLVVVVPSLWHQGCPAGAEVQRLCWSSKPMFSSLSSGNRFLTSVSLPGFQVR